MQKHKIFYNALLLTSWIMMIALAIVSVIQFREIRALQSENNKPYSGYQFATIQYTDDYTGELITVQGTLNFDAALQPVGTWLYEYNGMEAVLTGARVIGTDRVPYSTVGNVAIYLENGEFLSLYGTVVKPLENDMNLVFYMVDSKVTDRENILKDFFGEVEDDRE